MGSAIWASVPQGIGEMARLIDALLQADILPEPGELHGELWNDPDFRRLYLRIQCNREVAEQLQDLAHTDGLTGLPNRRALAAFLGRSVLEAERSGQNLSVLTFGLDRFRLVNEQHGRGLGDAVLGEVAGAVGGLFRQTDLLARYEGDRFVAVLCGSGRAGAEMVSERVLELLRGRRFGGERGLQLTVSVGAALLEADLDNPDDLRARSDEAMRRAKQEGGDRLCVWEP